MVSKEEQRTERARRSGVFQASMNGMNQHYLPVKYISEEEAGSYGEISFHLSKDEISRPALDPSTDTPQVYVVKTVIKTKFVHDEEGGTLDNEIEILGAIEEVRKLALPQHGAALHIVQMFRTGADNLWYSMESIKDGATLETVNHFMNDRSAFLFFKQTIIQQLVEVTHWLHTPNSLQKKFIIAHGDLNRQNIMIDLSRPVPSSSKVAAIGHPVPSVRIIDFGQGRLSPVDPEIFVSCLDYLLGVQHTVSGGELAAMCDSDYDQLAYIVDDWFPSADIPAIVHRPAINQEFAAQLVNYLGPEERRIGRALEVSTFWFETSMKSLTEEKVPLDKIVTEMRTFVAASSTSQVTDADISAAVSAYSAPIRVAPVAKMF